MTKTALKKQLWALVSSAIKKRDGYKCWKCGKSENLHCSHILAKGNSQYPKYEFQSWNLKTLCLHCHLSWWHKCPVQAAEWLKETRPDVYALAVEKGRPEVYKKEKGMTEKEMMELLVKLLG